MGEIPASTIDLVITHPPFVESDMDYRRLARQVFLNCFRVLKPNTILATVNHDRKNLYSAPRHIIIFQAAFASGFTPYEHKIWHRQNGNNMFRKTFGHIWFFAKGEIKRTQPSKDYYNDIWFLPDSMKRDDFPDAFHNEIPKRIIEAFTKEGDTVLDPFAGTGTTIKIAEALGRDAIGYEINPEMRKFYPANWEIIE